jgi:hypothetical protein
VANLHRSLRPRAFRTLGAIRQCHHSDGARWPTCPRWRRSLLVTKVEPSWATDLSAMGTPTLRTSGQNRRQASVTIPMTHFGPCSPQVLGLGYACIDLSRFQRPMCFSGSCFVHSQEATYAGLCRQDEPNAVSHKRAGCRRLQETCGPDESAERSDEGVSGPEWPLALPLRQPAASPTIQMTCCMPASHDTRSSHKKKPHRCGVF